MNKLKHLLFYSATTEVLFSYFPFSRKDVTSEEKTKLIDEAVTVAEGKENEVCPVKRYHHFDKRFAC